jgi:hypothetical protein
VTESKACSRCGELLPLDEFYFVSKKLGTYRGQCKNCMREVKREQREPGWKPSCAQCGRERERSGPGRRLCNACFEQVYEYEDRRANGAHRLRLPNCRACNVPRLRADHVKGTSLCGVCRSVSSGRRTRLKRLFNLNPREFLQLLESQGNVCAICKKKPRKSFHLDHSHADERIVRGAICNRCNTLLGLARDSQEILISASSYLDAPPAQALFPGRGANPEANRYNPRRGRKGKEALRPPSPPLSNSLATTKEFVK